MRDGLRREGEYAVVASAQRVCEAVSQWGRAVVSWFREGPRSRRCGGEFTSSDQLTLAQRQSRDSSVRRRARWFFGRRQTGGSGSSSHLSSTGSYAAALGHEQVGGIPSAGS